MACVVTSSHYNVRVKYGSKILPEKDKVTKIILSQPTKDTFSSKFCFILLHTFSHIFGGPARTLIFESNVHGFTLYAFLFACGYKSFTFLSLFLLLYFFNLSFCLSVRLLVCLPCIAFYFLQSLCYFNLFLQLKTSIVLNAYVYLSLSNQNHSLLVCEKQLYVSVCLYLVVSQVHVCFVFPLFLFPSICCCSYFCVLTFFAGIVTLFDKT